MVSPGLRIPEKALIPNPVEFQIWRVLSFNFMDPVIALNARSRGFPSVLDDEISDKRLIFNYWNNPMFDLYPSPLINAHRIKLSVHNVQRGDGAQKAEDRNYDGGTCSYFYPMKGTILVFLLACVSGLVIGLYLITKSGDFIAKTINCTPNCRAYFSNAIAYIGYTICLVTPFGAFCWLLWRIVACHGVHFL